jgi:hypothetical protein
VVESLFADKQLPPGKAQPRSVGALLGRKKAS